MPGIFWNGSLFLATTKGVGTKKAKPSQIKLGI